MSSFPLHINCKELRYRASNNNIGNVYVCACVCGAGVFARESVCVVRGVCARECVCEGLFGKPS